MISHIESRHYYSVPSLLSVFSEALKNKEAAVAALNLQKDDWRANYPDGNTTIGAFIVNWLQALQDQGVQEVVTPSPLTDSVVHANNTCANVHGSLYIQIKDKIITSVAP